MEMLCPVVRGTSKEELDRRFWEITVPRLHKLFLEQVCQSLADTVWNDLSKKSFAKDYGMWVEAEEEDWDVTGEFPVYGGIRYNKGNVSGVVHVYLYKDKKLKTSFYRPFKATMSPDGKFYFAAYEHEREFAKAIEEWIKKQNT